ncbi:MAG: queuosine precursor transporter [Spirochaetaceae bacterium]
MDGKLLYLTGIFSASLITASFIAYKTIDIAGFYAPAGIIAYSITYLITDVISEIYGTKVSKSVVQMGFIVLLVSMVLSHVSRVLPAAPFWNDHEIFDSFIGTNSRIIIASVIAYIVSQYNDVWLFHFFKRLTNNKYLWLRSIGSTTISQIIDSILFIFIAFYSSINILPMIMGQIIIKFSLAILLTPFLYLIRYSFLKKIKQES